MELENIIVSSELNKEFYPDNNGGCFTNNLNPILNLDSKCSIKMNDVAYVPGSWDTVRENSNEIKITMNGFMAERYVPAVIIVQNTNVTWKKRVRVGRRTKKHTDVMHFKLSVDHWEEAFWKPNSKVVTYESEWTKGQPWRSTFYPGDPAIFRNIFVSDIAKLQVFSINRNNNRIPILATDKALLQKEVTGITHIPTGHYNIFADFALTFVTYVDDLILKMLDENRAWPSVYEIRKLQLLEYKHFEQRHKVSRVPTSVWVFLQPAYICCDVRRVTGTIFYEEKYVCCTKDAPPVAHLMVSTQFAEHANIKISLSPIMQQQLGFTKQPHSYDYIPLDHRKKREIEFPESETDDYAKTRFWGVDFDHDRYATDKYLFDKDGIVTDWIRHFYGIDTMDFSRNIVKRMWVFCDCVEPSIVNSKKVPLVQMIQSIPQGHAISFQRYGMIFAKRINKTQLNSIKFWVCETFNGKPLHFQDPVIISLSIYRNE